MTATDELRRLLDERGVEWSGRESNDVSNMTEWKCSKIKAVAMEERDDGTLGLGATHLTPEQAIAATLGAGTCHDKNGFDPDTGFECTVCGAMVDDYMTTTEDTGHCVQFNFCPNCGRRVVEVDE